jgi:ferredoxin
MDGIIGLEGEGPGSSGTPINSGFLLASTNGLALDMVAAGIMGIEPEQVSMIRAAVKAGLGPRKAGEIVIKGTVIPRIEGFKLPPGSLLGKVPRFLSPVISYLAQKIRLTVPEVRESLCTKCLICLKSCPVNAITQKGGKLAIDRRKCIECFCCIELCPARAMSIKKGWLLSQAEKRSHE